MSKHMKLFFTVSVVLNLILLGMMGGGALHAHYESEHKFDRKFGGLPEDVKVKLKASFEEFREDIHASKEDAKAARQQLKNSMNGEAFDEDLYDAASDKLNKLRYEMMQHKAERTKTILQDLPADQRRQLLGYLLRGGMDGFHGGGSRGRDYSKVKYETKRDEVNLPSSEETIRAPQPQPVKGNGDNILTPIPE